jgi:hypothetical protein
MRARKQFNQAIMTLATEAGLRKEVLARWDDLDRDLSPKKAFKALGLTAAKVKASDKAKVTGKKPASEAKVTTGISVINGQYRFVTRVGGRISTHRAATKAEVKAAGLTWTKGSKKAKTTAVRQVKVNGKWVNKDKAPESKVTFLRNKTLDAYIAAAMAQDDEYLKAVRKEFGLKKGARPSIHQAVAYALNSHTAVEVPGFEIGEGYRKLHAEGGLNV